jgi:putative tryptophan/tyrosine transport system substrate-binding protein
MTERTYVAHLRRDAQCSGLLGYGRWRWEKAMRRREFITLGSAAAAWPLAARAQQAGLPVVGFLNPSSPQNFARPLAAFLKGLGEAGYVDGHNVAIEYRWADGHNDRLAAMAAVLVQRKMTVIAATTAPAALAAKAATATIPVVFETGGDPIRLGLVASLNRPGANVTGVTQTNNEVAPKRLELLHQLIPEARVFALLVNPADPAIAQDETSNVLSAARTLGLEVHVLNASTERDFDGVFASLTQLHAGGLVIGGDALFTGHIEQLAALAIQHAVPAVYQWREFAVAGGLLSYGADVTEANRLTGTYVGRVLNGDKPADLPVQQVTKVQLYINLKTAKALGLTVPLPLLGRADEVIE